VIGTLENTHPFENGSGQAAVSDAITELVDHWNHAFLLSLWVASFLSPWLGLIIERIKKNQNANAL